MKIEELENQVKQIQKEIEYLKKGKTFFYKDVIVFTAKEVDRGLEIQFNRYPDELRGIGKIGKVIGLEIKSEGSIAFYFDDNFYLPGTLKIRDNCKVTITDQSLRFAEELFELLKIEYEKRAVKYYYYTDIDYYFITYKSKVIAVDEKDIVFSDVTPEGYMNGSEKEITKEEFLEKTSKTNNKVKEYLEIIGV